VRNTFNEEFSMDEMTELRGAVDRVLLGDLDPLLDLLDEDVVFQVAGGGESPFCLENSGKRAVADYFTTFGGIMAFWQMDYAARGKQLIAWGKESFTVERCGLEGASEFALMFDLTEGLIIRLLVVEDLPSFIRNGGTSLLADPFPLEVEMHPVPRRDNTGQLPVLSAESVQLSLGRESFSLEVADDLLVFPAGFDRHPRRRHAPGSWLGRSRWKGYFDCC
jgi:hypothetical protein